jgi:putative peptidoglycan lipid II flippase
VAFRVPDLIFQVLAGATLASAFIPTFSRVFAREGEEAAWRMASSVVNLVFLATLVLAVLGFLFAPLLIPLIAPGLGDDTGQSAELEALAVELTRIMMLSPILFAVSGMFMGILNGRKQFVLPSLAPMLYNLAIMFAAVTLSKPWGVHGLAYGVVLGAGLHLAVQVPGLIDAGMR